MSCKKKQIDCRLKAIGTDKVNERVVDDLSIPDPEPAVGKQILEEELKDDGKSENSE